MKQSTQEYEKTLEDACNYWDLSEGRARAYIRRLDEFQRAETLSQEHILAYYESYEIVELFKLWKDRIDDFPGIEKKISKACGKGPFLRESELSKASSNRPRNDAFNFLVAGKLLSTSFSVVCVDSIPSRRFACKTSADLTFLWENKLVNVECKRPQSRNALRKLATKARKQIISSGRLGIIAIDCSVICRPNGTIFEASAQEQAENQLYEQLRYAIAPGISSISAKRLLGFLVFSRIPAMTATNFVDSGGKPIRRRDCITSWLAVGSHADQDCGILRNVAGVLRAQDQRHKIAFE